MQSAADRLHRHHKTHHLTWPYPLEEKNSLPPTQNEAEVPPNTKPIQDTQSRDQKQEVQPYRLGKGDLKHSELDKMKDREIPCTWRNKTKKKKQVNKEKIDKLSEKEFRAM